MPIAAPLPPSRPSQSDPLRWTTIFFAAAFAAALAMTLTGAGLAGLAALMTLLTLFVALIVSGFSERYLRADQVRGAFAAKLTAMVSTSLLFANATDVVALAIGWIGAGVAMAVLVGHVRGWPEARRAQRRAALHFLVADVALIGALALLASQAGTGRIDDIVISITSGDARPTLAALLLVVAAMARCALPPFARWLTHSMAAPTPVSALMHAGFVNAGGVLLIRFGPVLERAPIAQALATSAGVAAVLWGSAIMLVRPDVKRSLAGSTVAQMGFMLMSCGLGAYAAACWHLIAHGLFKAWLFFSSGSAIGRPAADEGGRTPLALALAAASVAGASFVAAVFGSRALQPSSVPALLAVATAAAAIPMLGRNGFALLPAAGLAMLYLGGLALTHNMLPHATGPAPGGAILGVLLVALFLACWLGQWALLRRGRSLPVRLHARLLNS